MKILINAISIKEGGGAVVFFKTFNQMLLLDKNIQWIVVIDEVMREKINANEHVTLLIYPWIKKSPFHYLYWNEFFLKKFVRKNKIDCVFSVINTLPFRRLSCPTLLSTLHAGYFSNEFIALNNKFNRTIRNRIGWAIRKYWASASIIKANKVVSPTKALADNIIKRLNVNLEKIDVVLPGPGLADGVVYPKNSLSEKTWRIGYITKYGVQKNFDVLFQAASKLKSQGLDFKIVLTLNTEHQPYQYVQRMIDKYDIADVIENHGEITDKQIKDLYLSLNLFVFPSLCESIGFTLLESMYYGIPVVAADIASNRELLGENGVFFKPYDADQLLTQLLSIINDGNLYSRMSKYSIEQSHRLTWQQSADETLKVLKGMLCVTN